MDGARHLARHGSLTESHHPHSSPARKVLVLLGPTASGKTALSIPLAQLLNAEIISADSRQVYKYLDVATAKPGAEQRALVRHYFVDELEPDQDLSAGEFGARGRAIIRDLLSRNKVPLVVGGSGLYLTSLIDGLFEGPGADREFREAMEARIKAHGIQPLLDELRRVDPTTGATADITKPRRIIRALEVYQVTGIPISEHHRAQRVQRDFQPVLYGLDWDRKQLYERIERRCEQMLAQGLLEEVENLERRGFDDSLNSLNTVGYAEAIAYRKGEMSYSELVSRFKQNSRRYAKRQMTWFRRDPRVTWIRVNEATQFETVAREIAAQFLG